MTPVRIQRRRTKGWRMPPNTVYVGRPTKWGNHSRVGDEDPDPFHAGERMDAATVVGYYEWALSISSNAEAWASPLAGKNLACYCGLCPAHAAGLPFGVYCRDCPPCHATYLGAVANGRERTLIAARSAA